MIVLNMEECIKEFMLKYDQQIRVIPQLPTYEEKVLRFRLIKEEMNELLDALRLDNLELIADGIADSLVVIIGTALAYGIPLHASFLEAHNSNMSKNGPKDEDGKVTKGDYTPPNFRRVLEEHGWRG